MTPRTYLFVPGDRPERFDKAFASGADAVVLDLEDAVTPEHKEAARETVRQRLATGDTRLVVRINDESTAWFEADVASLPKAATVMLPKAERTATVKRLNDAGFTVLALIESARGVLNAEAIAEVSHRLVFGTVDFALDVDVSGDLASTLGLDYAASRLVLASRAAGLPSPVAGVTVAIDDEALLLAELARARAHGFGAKLCIHPKQVAPIHRALAPSAAELDWARRVIAVAAGAHGAVQVDGRMVDKPILLRAERLLAREQK